MEVRHRHHIKIARVALIRQRVAKLFQRQHRKIALRIAIAINLNRGARHAFVRPILDDRFDQPRPVQRHIPDHLRRQRHSLFAQQLVQRPGVQLHRIVQIRRIDGDELRCANGSNVRYLSFMPHPPTT